MKIYACNDKIIPHTTNVLAEELQYVLTITNTFKDIYEGIKWAKTCKFSDPWPPMHATVILEPSDVDEDAQHLMFVQLQSKISAYLQRLGTDDKDTTNTQFLQELQISHE